MAGNFFYVPIPEVALVANTAKSVVQIKASTNVRIMVHGYAVFGKGVSSTDTPIKGRFTRSTANFGTFTAATLAKLNPSNAETLQCTGSYNATVEPTTPTDINAWFEVHPQQGYDKPLPPEEWLIPVPGGNSLQMELTAAQAQTVSGWLYCEE